MVYTLSIITILNCIVNYLSIKRLNVYFNLLQFSQSDRGPILFGEEEDTHLNGYNFSFYRHKPM